MREINRNKDRKKDRGEKYRKNLEKKKEKERKSARFRRQALDPRRPCASCPSAPGVAHNLPSVPLHFKRMRRPHNGTV
eukprot:1215855-Rhodomonas_salina.2